MEMDRGSNSLRGSPIRGPRDGPSGGTSHWWAPDCMNFCQDWAYEVGRGSHSHRGPPIRGLRAGPSGGTSQWLAHDWRNCCQDWTVRVSMGPHSLRGSPNRGPRDGSRADTSQTSDIGRRGSKQKRSAKSAQPFSIRTPGPGNPKAAKSLTMSLTPVLNSFVSKSTGRQLSGSCNPGGPGPGSIVFKKPLRLRRK